MVFFCERHSDDDDVDCNVSQMFSAIFRSGRATSEKSIFTICGGQHSYSHTHSHQKRERGRLENWLNMTIGVHYPARTHSHTHIHTHPQTLVQWKLPRIDVVEDVLWKENLCEHHPLDMLAMSVWECLSARYTVHNRVIASVKHGENNHYRGHCRLFHATLHSTNTTPIHVLNNFHNFDQTLTKSYIF